MINRTSYLKRKSLLIGLFFTLTLQLFGCAFGYYSYKTIDQSITQPTENLSAIKIAYFATPETNITSSLERTLRERFLISNIKKIKGENIQKDDDRFFINAKLHYEDYSATSTVWGLVSVFSLATIPAIVDRDASVTYVITAPNGDEKTYQYQFTERLYSWLPFMVLAPDFFYIFLGGNDDHQKLFKTLDQITTRFVVDASPFIVSHSKFSEVP